MSILSMDKRNLGVTMVTIYLECRGQKVMNDSKSLKVVVRRLWLGLGKKRSPPAQAPGDSQHTYKINYNARCYRGRLS